MEIRNNLISETGWEITEPAFDEEQLVTNGSNFMTGNGYLGYRGTFPGWRSDRYVGCVVTNTWDNADGKWKELCTVPNALYLQISEASEGPALELPESHATAYRRELDFRYGIHRRDVRFATGEGSVRVRDERFASYENLHLVVTRIVIESDVECTLDLECGIDSHVWSLNGNHFSSVEPSRQQEELLVEALTQEQGITIAVAQACTITGGAVEQDIQIRESSIMRTAVLRLEANTPVEITLAMSVYHSRDVSDPQHESVEAARAFVASGYESHLEKHRRHWDARWNDGEVVIDGDERAQTLLRYNMYHNYIATPAFSDELPIGARGLSCQAYQGGAFWDQEIFNLPMFLYTRPEVARKILTYRYKTLDGARRKAESLGFRGAFFAWVSVDSGDEVCPSYFFVDVLTGRRIHNHFNDWQIHVSPDIAYTVWKYFESTGDWQFMLDHGAELVLEIMRFLASHAYYKWESDQFEFIRLLGPDEYHENVDNNFFTNFQARYVADICERLFRKLRDTSPGRLLELREKLSITDEELNLWKKMAASISVPEPDPQTGVIEQFRGFYALEEITPERLAERLKDKSEYWGWPNGIAVETQVSKQADVTQLFALHPHAYDRAIMKANYDYYEPRTQHGSSLSYSVYAMVAAWLDDEEQAYRYFLRSLSVDLLSTNKAVSGGTFIGGIHTAACGVSWQIAVHGFGGTFVTSEGLHIEPHLPQKWTSISFPFVFQGQRARITVTHGSIAVAAAEENDQAFEFQAFSTGHSVAPGEQAELVRS
jgi:1,2-alpha-glucosylglycerol phosphorylase